MRRKKRNGCLSVLMCITLICCVISGAAAVIWFQQNSKKVEKKESANVSQIVSEEVTNKENLNFKYYFSLLPDNEKEVYLQIMQGMKDTASEITVNFEDVDRANVLFQYVLKDYPEFFWCKGSVNSTVYQSTGKETYTILRPEYMYTGEEKAIREEALEREVNACISGISADASEYDKILYVYEYIVNSVDYVIDAPDNQNLYSALVGKQSVCAGYSRAAQYLLERMGIFCTYITGFAKGQEPHAWNLVKCEGVYYYLDVTWGDPVYLQTDGQNMPNQTNISYDYMCCSYEELSKTHTPDDSSILPECGSMEQNYYVKNGMYYSDYNKNEILNAMNDSIANKQNSVVLKFSSEEAYLQAKNEMKTELIGKAVQNLCDWYGLQQVQYFYEDDPLLSKITIYWQYE